MSSRNAKLILVATIIVLIVAFFAFDLQRFLTLEYLKDRQQAFSDFYAANRLLTIAIYFILYVVVTALSLPGAAVMTLAGGGLLGFWTALVTVSFASTIGATLAFLASRFLLRDWVQGKFGDKLKAINEGVEREVEAEREAVEQLERIVLLVNFLDVLIVVGRPGVGGRLGLARATGDQGQRRQKDDQTSIEWPIPVAAHQNR